MSAYDPAIEGPRTSERKIIWQGNDDQIGSIYVDLVQVAGAVKLSPAYAQMTRCEYHITSILTQPDGMPPLLCVDRERAVQWLEFLADLYEGKHTEEEK